MRLSLRARAFVLVTAINAAVFTVVGLVLSQRTSELSGSSARLVTEQLDYVRQVTLRPKGKLNVARILRWPGWGAWPDALLVDKSIDERADGTYVPFGVALNPLGAAGRGALFDEQAVLAAIVRAMETGEPVSGVEGGRAVPIEGESGVWGGLWYRDIIYLGPEAVFWTLLPWFLVSTLLLSAATFYSQRKLVLEPVEQLARGARRIQGGDLSTRLPEPSRTDEISQLVRAFNEMAGTIEGFNARLADEVERATDKATRAESAAMTQRRLAAMGELAAGIAHEINNPLGGLLNAVEVIGREDAPPERRTRYVALLHDGLERIRATVGKLLRFTPRATRPVPVDLGDVARDAVDLVAHRAGRAGVEVALRIEDDLPRIEGEPNELGQAVLNLLANALDSLEEGPGASEEGSGSGRIEVAVERRGDQLLLSVEDDGPGVAADTVGRISDLFYTTKDVGRGSGLGLALVHNVVTAHRGRVLLHSEEGGGFRAEVWLPAAGPGVGGEGGGP